MKVLPGFTQAKKGRRKRLVIASEGLEKQGKTNFGLTMPGPLVVFDMDRGLEDVVDKFVDEKDIQIVDYRGMMQGVATNKLKDMFQTRWEKFNADYKKALEAPLDVVRSILLDTGTEMWEYARLGVLGKLTQVPPLFYPEVNQQFRRIVDLALDHDKNVLITHKMKKEYKKGGGEDSKDSWTGRYERAGFGEIGNLVQVILRNGRRFDRDEGWGEFYVRVEACRQNPDIVGEEFDGVMCAFPFLATQIFPDTGMEEWE
jgi:hypothetical protein